MADVTVRLKALDGVWETCGVDRAAGVFPENVDLGADGYGSKTASFDLRRDPSQVWPDIGAFTPVQVEIDGSGRVWSGRVSETPSRDGTDQIMSVACDGMQAHLDDDLYERKYVHTNMGDWKDQRGELTATLANFPASSSVTVGDGAIVLGWPLGDQVPATG